MNQIAEKRIGEIAQKFLTKTGTTAITSWTPSDFERLEGELHSTIMHEYPGLDTNLRFHITQFTGGSPNEVHVEISRVLGEVKVKL